MTTNTTTTTATTNYKPGRGRRQYVTIKWIMDYLHVGRGAVYGYAKRMGWHVYRVGAIGRPRFDAAEIEASLTATRMHE